MSKIKKQAEDAADDYIANTFSICTTDLESAMISSARAAAEKVFIVGYEANGPSEIDQLKSTLDLVSDEVRKIKKQYICGVGEHGDGLTAEEGYDELIERIKKKIKKAK
jgi:hypothetical protein|tara:strand:- start:813 stop:1139 length:327 start_codon:yes stop_codon:yes gene_type:complete